MASKNEQPEVSINDNLKDVIIEISAKRLGATAVTENGNLKGIITDGDLRRMLSKSDNYSAIKAKDIMSTSAKTIESESLAAEALKVMQDNNISQLVVLESGKYKGFVHIHDLIREGIL